MSTAKPGDVFNVAVGQGNENRWVLFRCPGCRSVDREMALHSLATRPHVGTEPSWEWNGDVVKPVLSPSILAQYTMSTPPVTHANLEEWKRAPWPQTKVNHVCHSFVGCNGAQPGQIIYLGDCTHALAGQTIDLPPWFDGNGRDAWGDDS